MNSSLSIAYYIFIVIASLILVWMLASIYRTDRVFSNSALPDTDDDENFFIDPWVMQAELMTASDQMMPASPSFNNTTLLYLALIFEEVAETVDAVHKVLEAERRKSRNGFIQSDNSILWSLYLAKKELAKSSISLRSSLKDHAPFSFPLTQEQAVEILDGTTDIAVVNAGFCLASGMPGSEAYYEVVNSNLSKRNYKGKIEKGADGKWIKGPNYQEPDLAKVLQRWYSKSMGL